MSRSTQYIGLTKKAQDWIGKNEWEYVFNPKNWTCGMFMEKVSLGEWRYSHSGLYIREVVQAEPWSSGLRLRRKRKLEEILFYLVSC